MPNKEPSSFSACRDAHHIPLSTFISPHIPVHTQAAAATLTSGGSWSGRIKHRLDTGEGTRSTVELFSASAVLPESVLEQLPPVVFVCDLANRDSVRVKRHTVHRMHMGPLTPKQHLKLMVSACCVRGGAHHLCLCACMHCVCILVCQCRQHCDLAPTSAHLAVVCWLARILSYLCAHQ